MNFLRRYKKALEALVYVANMDHRHYWVLKTIYFADKEHLSRYGRQIFDEKYCAMKQGPVPSLAYDIIKYVRGDGWYSFDNPDPRKSLNVPDKYTVKPLRQPDKKIFSQTEIECLEVAYHQIKDLSFSELKNLSHDKAFLAVEQDEEISIEDIIAVLPNSDDVMDYLYKY